MIFIRLDENISHKIGDAAEMIGIPEGVVIDTPQRLRQSGIADVDWMTSHAARGRPGDRKIAFSADGFTDAERAHAETLGITLFSTPRMYWRPLRKLGQAAYVLHWLVRMIETAEAHPPGAQFRLPGHFRTNVTLRPLKSVLRTKVSRPGRPKKDKPKPLLDRIS